MVVWLIVKLGRTLPRKCDLSFISKKGVYWEVSPEMDLTI